MRSTRTERLALVSLAALVALAGCQGDGQTTASGAPKAPPEWSTKEQSILPTDPDLVHLNLPAASAEHPTETQVRRAAIALLEQAADSTNPQLRANAIESLQAAPEAIEPVVRTALADENEGVRFAAVMTVAKLRLHRVAPLVEPMLLDRSPSVQAAAILALDRCGREVNPTPLASMIRSDDPTVRGNAVLVIGELGDPSALGMLREAVQHRSPRVPVARQKIVELQIAEAMVKLGADGELEVIRAALFSPAEQGEIVVLACDICAELHDEGYVASMLDKALREGRDEEPVAIRLAATQAVARIDPDRAPASVPLAFLDHDEYLIRAQAAIALGWFRDPAFIPALAPLMNDRNALVQVAAAGAVVRSTAGMAGTAANVDTNLGER